MSAGFVYLRPLSVVCIRALGPYATSSQEAWRQMFAWLDDSGMRRDVGCGYGLMHDNPHFVPKEECRYDACVELIEGYESAVPVGFRFMRLPGGAYARQRMKGIGGLGDAISDLRDGWVPSNGLKIEPARPFIEIHLDDPAKVAENQRRIDICVPVGVAASSHRAA